MRELGFDTKLPQKGADHIPYPDLIELARYYQQAGVEAFAGNMVGTGAALDSPALPFDPAMVLLVDETQNVLAIKFPSQPTDTATTVKAAAVGAAAASITLGMKKFTLGTNADVNTVADVIRFVAIGFRDQGGSL